MILMKHIEQLASALGRLFAPTPNEFLPTSCPITYEREPDPDTGADSGYGRTHGPRSGDTGRGL